MIQANELKLGNLVVCKHSSAINEVLPIYSIHGDSTIRLLKNNESIGCFKLSWINPIKLTEEILLKCVFEWDLKKVYLCINKTEFRVRYSNHQVTLFQFGNHVTIPNIVYLHQLQNLYFALTNNELIIEL